LLFFIQTTNQIQTINRIYLFIYLFIYSSLTLNFSLLKKKKKENNKTQKTLIQNTQYKSCEKHTVIDHKNEWKIEEKT
jgi:hypothetical protein